MSEHPTSIVHYFSDNEGTKCGYCESLQSYFSKGMWVYYIDCRTYEMLLDRGWRRSGQYCYKPTMKTTCCPMYTIRCEVEDFFLSRSQKKVIKKMNAFLKTGKRSMDIGSTGDLDNVRARVDDDKLQEYMKKVQNVSYPVVPASSSTGDVLPSTSGNVRASGSIQHSEKVPEVKDTKMERTVESAKDDKEPEEMNEESIIASQSNIVNAVSTMTTKEPSADHAPRKKAKLIRQENKYKRLLKNGLSKEEAQEMVYNTKKTIPEKKELEDLLYELQEEDVAHRLEVKLVKTKPLSPEYIATAEEAYLLYRKYQMKVHGDTDEECTRKKYNRFLVDSPLIPYQSNYTPISYGSFQQQYWLDGTLIAVGVIDILFYCISSVYFFYDPDLRDLSLGTYGSLREIALVREFRETSPNFTFYYMGYYIHSCPKMNYKGRYYPSYLLCPEVYSWHKIEDCIPKLRISKYCRLDEDPKMLDENLEVDWEKVHIYKNHELMTYPQYKVRYPNELDKDLPEYMVLVGGACAQKIAIVR